MKKFIFVLIFFKTSLGFCLNTSLGLSKKGLLYTLSTIYLDQLYTEPPSDEFSKVENVSSYFENQLETNILLNKIDSTFYLTHQLIHPFNSQIPNHLVIIIPGFGSQSDGATSRLFLNFLSERGFAVASLDSPAAYRFIKNTSLGGNAGNQLEDAKILYELIKISIPFLEKKVSQSFQFKKVSIIGASLGGLNAHLIALLNKEDTSYQLNFHKIISINPPIRNSYSLETLDKAIITYRKHPLYYSINFGLSFTPYMNIGSINFSDLQNLTHKLILSNISAKEAYSMVGKSFSDTLAQAVESTKLRHPNLSLNATSFLDYYYQVHLTNVSKHQRNYRVLDKDSIFENASKLNTIDSYYLITFDDDLLIDASDVEFIQTSLGKKSTVFIGGGGHLGGYFRNDFQTKIIELLR